jgi:hypothetical protein
VTEQQLVPPSRSTARRACLRVPRPSRPVERKLPFWNGDGRIALKDRGITSLMTLISVNTLHFGAHRPNDALLSWRSLKWGKQEAHEVGEWNIEIVAADHHEEAPAVECAELADVLCT